MNLKYNLLCLILCGSLLSCDRGVSIPYGQTVEISREAMMDKIMGGWAGQTIGCTYGGPTEFKYKGALISDKAPIPWYEDYIYDTFVEDPGLFDDVYMDLTFVETMQAYGIDAPARAYAEAFAHADYKLWHANQAARYNILHGIHPPLSGYWANNPHADDIDFQIESDFIGMICPGYPNASSRLCDEIGHIMNFGNGWYGGVYVGAMYSLAFVCEDIPTIVSEALTVLPKGCEFRQCIEDVIRFHRQYPRDWRRCWLEIENRHAYEKGCPEGVFNGFNIDAKINAAYIVMGLLYGEGDFFKTMDVATRCGQDSDCNPASAAGILGVAKGYQAIPETYRRAMEKVMDIDFAYTHISLNTVFPLNMKFMEEVVRREGGQVTEDSFLLVPEKPFAVPMEISFDNLEPAERRVLKKKFQDNLILDFEGSAVVVMGQITQLNANGDPSYVALIEASIDGKVLEVIEMPYDYITRKYDIFYRYDLTGGTHRLSLKVLNPNPDFTVEAKEMVVYTRGKRN